MNEELICIKDVEIPIVVKSYKTSKSIKIFFKNGKITITKPIRVGKKDVMAVIKENADFIYDTYKKEMEKNHAVVKNWETGEVIYYKGEVFQITREMNENSTVHIYIVENEKKFRVVLPSTLSNENAKKIIDGGIRNLFKNNTQVLLNERLPYWSKLTGIKYNSFKVRDAVTRYGSCVKQTGALHFSSRIIMLPEHITDAIIVHELCHIVHANHSKQFYALVEKYIPNYKEIDKWLKKNGEMIRY